MQSNLGYPTCQQHKLVIVIILLLLIILYLFGVGLRQQSDRQLVQLRQEKWQMVTFTNDELNYIKYGEGNKEVVGRRDQRYLRLIRSQIAWPSSNKLKTRSSNAPGQHEKFVENRLKGRRNGFFVECGANDGYFQSNTIYLENMFNWSGLLVEANPRLAKTLMSRNRQAFVYGGCLSPIRRPTTLKFTSAGCCGGLSDFLTKTQHYVMGLYSKVESVDWIQCYPLNDLLAAIGVNHVDYMALDVHGSELAILKTIDFKELRVDMMTIECVDLNLTRRRQMADEIATVFAETGLYHPVQTDNPNDLIVIRKILAIDSNKTLN